MIIHAHSSVFENKTFFKTKNYLKSHVFYVLTKAFGITCYHLSCSIVTEWLKRKYDFLRVLVSLGSCEPAPGRAQFLSWIPALTETRGQSLWSPVTWRHSGDQGIQSGKYAVSPCQNKQEGRMCGCVINIFKVYEVLLCILMY